MLALVSGVATAGTRAVAARENPNSDVYRFKDKGGECGVSLDSRHQKKEKTLSVLRWNKQAHGHKVLWVGLRGTRACAASDHDRELGDKLVKMVKPFRTVGAANRTTFLYLLVQIRFNWLCTRLQKQRD